MNKERKQQIKELVKQSLEYMSEVPEGTELSTSRILSNMGYDLGDIGNDDLMAFHEAFIEASKPFFELEFLPVLVGMPWNCPFIVHYKYKKFCGGISPILDEPEQ